MAEIRLMTEMKEVHIFKNGVQVERQGSTELAQGMHTLIISGLTAAAAVDTARLFCSEGLHCTDLHFAPLSELTEEQERKKELEQLMESLETKQNEMEILKLQMELLKSNADFTTKEQASPTEILDYIDMLPERLQKARQQVSVLQKEAEKLQEQITRMQEEDSHMAAVVKVTAAAAGTYHFILRYYDPAAGWEPIYEVHTEGEGSLELKLRARLRQWTGEEWKDVATTLSTGNPQIGGSLPEITPVYLDIREPVQEKARGLFSMAPQMMGMSAAIAENAVYGSSDEDVMEDMSASVMSRIETPEAEVSSEETMTEYRLPGTVQVPDGGDGRLLDLQTYAVPAQFRIIAVPAVDTHAFLMAAVEASELPMLNAVTAGIYYKGMYTGKALLDPDSEEGELRIPLGREERISVSRREKVKRTSRMMLAGKKATEYEYEITVSNLSDSERDLILRDQVPVSRNKDILVEMKESLGTEPDAETGIITEILQLGPGETRKLRLSYKVTVPKDKLVRETRELPVRRSNLQDTQPIPKFCPECASPITGRFCPVCGYKP